MNDIKVGNTFGDSFGENEYTVTATGWDKVWRKNVVWTIDLDGNTVGFSVEQVNNTIRNGGFFK